MVDGDEVDTYTTVRDISIGDREQQECRSIGWVRLVRIHRHCHRHLPDPSSTAALPTRSLPPPCRVASSRRTRTAGEHDEIAPAAGAYLEAGSSSRRNGTQERDH